MNRLAISKETVFAARASLPRASESLQAVMEVDVMTDDGQSAAIEFQRYLIVDELGHPTWSWEAVSCWVVADLS
jgi:hypothetical protein